MKFYRAENIGSMLRPDYLLKAREEYTAGKLSPSEFKKIEDKAVDDAIAIQEKAGVDIITDGELRRNVFSSQLYEASEGFEKVDNNYVDWFKMDGTVERSPVTMGLVGKIKRKRHLSSEEFAYLRAKTNKPKKMTLPSPTMYAYYWVPGLSEAAYPNVDAYMADVVDILRDEVKELVRLGCEYIQFDAPELGMIIDPHQQEWFTKKGFRPDKMLDEGMDMLNTVMKGYSDITFGLHVCRGNDANRYMAKGGYDFIAEKVYKRTDARVLLLEYDDPNRMGDFSSLKYVPEDKVVVLGLITTKSPRLESKEELKSRIKEAEKYVPLERLALSPQCGFASVAKGNNLPYDFQDTKLRLVSEVAREVWKVEEPVLN